LGAFALVAGALQIVATAALGRARSDAIARAAAEGATLYLVGALASGLGLLVVWLLRRRPLVAAVTFLLWQGAVFWPLRARGSRLGLAYHGEYILHHFVALLSAAVCMAVLSHWIRRIELGRARFGSVVLGGLGSIVLLFSHVVSQPSLLLRLPESLHQAATAALLSAVIVALVVFWRRMQPPTMRMITALLLVPLMLRVGLAFPGGLAGAPVPMWGRSAVMTAIVIAATVTFVSFRPRMAMGLRIAVMALSALATAFLYVLYRRGFGELEDDVGGLAQSLFGFPLPYPNYVSDLKIFASMVGLFFIFNVVYGGLLASAERHRGVAFGLLCVAGLGLTNAQLALMVGAALLLLLDTSLRDDHEPPAMLLPPTPVDEILLATAERLGLPQPVTLADAPRTVVAMRGEVSSTSIDVRARRSSKHGWAVELRVGVIGRGRPSAELVPDDSQNGARPAHELGRTHRIEGSARALEQIGDPVLDAIIPFPRSRARFWEAGTSIALGDDLEQLEPGRLARLIVRLARSLG
jgi:hypothetical protein